MFLFRKRSSARRYKSFRLVHSFCSSVVVRRRSGIFQLRHGAGRAAAATNSQIAEHKIIIVSADWAKSWNEFFAVCKATTSLEMYIIIARLPQVLRSTFIRSPSDTIQLHWMATNEISSASMRGFHSWILFQSLEGNLNSERSEEERKKNTFTICGLI